MNFLTLKTDDDEIKVRKRYSHLKVWSMCNISCK